MVEGRAPKAPLLRRRILLTADLRPSLPGAVATAARGVLLRRGFGKSQVMVHQEGAGLAVSIQLIDGRATLVRSIHLSVEGL